MKKIVSDVKDEAFCPLINDVCKGEKCINFYKHASLKSGFDSMDDDSMEMALTVSCTHFKFRFRREVIQTSFNEAWEVMDRENRAS